MANEIVKYALSEKVNNSDVELSADSPDLGVACSCGEVCCDGLK